MTCEGADSGGTGRTYKGSSGQVSESQVTWACRGTAWGLLTPGTPAGGPSCGHPGTRLQAQPHPVLQRRTVCKEGARVPRCSRPWTARLLGWQPQPREPLSQGAANHPQVDWHLGTSACVQNSGHYGHGEDVGKPCPSRLSPSLGPSPGMRGARHQGL